MLTRYDFTSIMNYLSVSTYKRFNVDFNRLHRTNETLTKIVKAIPTPFIISHPYKTFFKAVLLKYLFVNSFF